MNQKIYNLSRDNKNIKELISKYKSKNKKIVFTNGCFDILHIGHIRYLFESKKLGDVLIVGINSDSSIKKLKGETRPINDEMDRAELLLALKPVDEVIIFNEETPLNLITLINPNILVKGGDWSIKNIIGSDHVITNGGEVKSINFQDGHSTTNIILKIRNLKG